MKDGSIWAAPFKLSGKPGFWYRKSFFADNNLTVPTTYDEFKNTLLPAIKAIPGIEQAIASGDTTGWPLSDQTEGFLMGLGGYQLQLDLETGPSMRNWTDPQVKSVFANMTELLEAGYFSTPAEWTSQITKLWDGKYGLYWQGGFITTMPQVLDVNDLGFFGFPGTNGAVGAVDYAVITKEAPHLNEAKQLVQYLAGPDAQEIMVKQGGFLATNLGVPSSAYKPIDKTVVDFMGQTGINIVPDLDDTIGGQWQTTFWDQLKLLWTSPSTSTMNSVLDALQNGRNTATRNIEKRKPWCRQVRNRKKPSSLFLLLRRVFTVSRLFLIPAFLLLAIFVFYPIVDTIYMSFLAEGTGSFVGLGNYNYVLFQKLYPLINIPDIFQGVFPMGALVQNIIWIGIHLPLTILLGLFFAVLLRDVKGGTIIKSIVFLGVIVPMVVGGVLFRFIFDKDAGIVNAVLRLIGLGGFARDWTAFASTSLISLILGSVWIWTGFCMIVYSAGLEGISMDMYEAAAIDGASRWKTFWRITVPMLRSTTLVVVTMTVLWELKIFDIVYVATFGGPGGASRSLSFDMYIQTFYQTAKFWHGSSNCRNINSTDLWLCSVYG